MVGKESKELFCDTWELCEIQISVSINKILLEHSCAHSFFFFFKVLFIAGDDGSWIVVSESVLPPKLHICSLVFTEKVCLPSCGVSAVRFIIPLGMGKEKWSVEVKGGGSRGIEYPWGKEYL